MKKIVKVVVSALAILMICSSAFALSHQPLGVLGMQPGTAPGPGFYYINMISNITADVSMDADGHRKDNNFDFDLYTVSNLFMYSTKYKIFGGNYYTKVCVPIILDQEIGFDAGPAQLGGDSAGLDDIDVTPIGIGWHKERYDLLTEATIFLPTGRYSVSKPLEAIGKDHYTLLLAVGGTYYFDEAKKYFGSIKVNYETNLENEHSDFTEGDHLHTTFGAGVTVGKGIKVGLMGYYLKQITDDSGADGIKTNNEEVWGVAPEISTFIPDLGVNVRIRYVQEFNAVDRSQGKQVRLVIGKRF